MKLIITLTVAAVLSTLWYVSAQTARLTSDASKSATVGFPPVPSGIYQPPQPSIAIIWHTNVQPLTVRITVSSNVVPRWVWIDQGKVYTNCGAPLSSNVISVVTNSVP